MAAAVDLHIHSCFSLRDGLMAPRTVVRLARKLGYEAVAVTDHYDYERVLRGTAAAARLAKEQGIRAFMGTEYSVTNGPTRGHVLIYFDHLDQAPRRGLTLDELVDHARAEGLPLIHPHPYGYAGIQDEAFMRQADYVELSGSYGRGSVNRRLMDLARQNGFEHKLVGNTDAHARGQMGSAYTLVEEVHETVADTLATRIGAGLQAPRRRWGRAAKMARAAFAPVGLAFNAASILATRRALARLPTA